MTFLPVTRAIVVASTILAALAEAFLATTYTPQVLWISVAGFLLMIAIGRQWRRVAMPALMAALYLTPALLLVSISAKGYEYDAIWMLPLLGLVLSERAAWHEWSLPARWQWPLITWAAIVAIGWPLVFLREADFALWILPLERVSNTSIGISPWLVNQGVSYFSLGHLLGILVVDALWRWYREGSALFRREVQAPLLASAAIAAVVAIYQGFVDLGFLNEGFWAYMLRASGTLGDPNKLGAVTAFWTIGAVVFARKTAKPWNVVVPIVALVLGICAVWVSGSRTGLAGVGVSVMIAAIESVRLVKLDLRKLAIAGVVALVIGAATIIALQSASTHTIVQRGSLGYVPFFGDRGMAASANELLWDRFGYGPAAIQMIKEHPVAGVGAGTFHTLYYDFGKVAGRELTAPDNAQAWWRHNLAELGFAGVMPIIWWCVVFGRKLFSRSAGGDKLSIGLLRGVLIGFFVTSMFGVPSQSVAITITFWAFAFWFASEHQGSGARGAWSQRLVIAATVLIALHAGTTAADAVGDLRPRNRAQRFDWYYRYGYLTTADGADVEPDPGGNKVGRRWTMKDSLAVVKVQGEVLKFVAWIDHPDSDVNPVHTQVWADGNLVYEGELRRSPLFLDLPATPGKSHMVIETSIERTFRPSDAGNSRDTRALGLSIRDWTWQ